MRKARLSAAYRGPQQEIGEKCGLGAVRVGVSEEHHVASAIWAVRGLARSVGLSRVGVYSVATAVSELANNIFFHGCGGGDITATEVGDGTRVGVEVVAEDRGPGIADVALAMQDGFTTNGGLGGGLPGVERLMDEFEITSSVGMGTRVVARKWRNNAKCKI